MKIKDGYVLREVAGNSIVVAVGSKSMDLNGLITLNETGTFLWKQLLNECDEKKLLESIMNEYEVDEKQAKVDINNFINMLKGSNLLEE